eukprot:216961-Pelagomonas_calceolata.AAC.2
MSSAPKFKTGAQNTTLSLTMNLAFSRPQHLTATFHLEAPKACGSDTSTQGSPRIYASFIDLKQAYDLIPRVRMWEHLHKCQMPSQLISIMTNLYQDDKYILIDGDKRASVQPMHGVKQGCPLSPLLFSTY